VQSVKLGLYIADREIMPTRTGTTIILGKITVSVYAFHEENVDEVEFYLDDRLVKTDETMPYETTLDETTIGEYTITAKAYYNDETTPTDQIDAWIFNT
jgi:uncharacterized protein YxeA